MSYNSEAFSAFGVLLPKGDHELDDEAAEAGLAIEMAGNAVTGDVRFIVCIPRLTFRAKASVVQPLGSVTITHDDVKKVEEFARKHGVADPRAGWYLASFFG